MVKKIPEEDLEKFVRDSGWESEEEKLDRMREEARTETTYILVPDGYQTAIYVSWEESERNWIQRPDGCSLHLSVQDAEKYEKDYWDQMPSGIVLDEYSRPAGLPIEVFVSSELYDDIEKSSYGLRFWKHDEYDLLRNKDLKYGEERSGWMPRNK